MRRNPLWKYPSAGVTLVEDSDAALELEGGKNHFLVGTPTQDRVIQLPNLDDLRDRFHVFANEGGPGAMVLTPQAGETIGGAATYTLPPKRGLILKVPATGTNVTVAAESVGHGDWLELTDAHLKAGEALATPTSNPTAYAGASAEYDADNGWRFNGTDSSTSANNANACIWHLKKVTELLDSTFSYDGRRTVQLKIVPADAAPTEHSTRFHLGVVDPDAAGAGGGMGVNLVSNGVFAWTGGVTGDNTNDSGHGECGQGMEGVIIPYGNAASGTRVSAAGRGLPVTGGLYANLGNPFHFWSDTDARLFVGFTYRTSGSAAKTSQYVRMYARVIEIFPT